METGEDALLHDFYVVESEQGIEEHSEDLPQPLNTGTLIRLAVFVKKNCQSFAIYLVCDENDATPSQDIALKFNPRLIARHIEKNSRIKDRWGKEEKSFLPKIPFDRKVDIQILTAENEFLIAMNGSHLCAYSFRMDPLKVKKVTTQGYVFVESMVVSTVTMYPIPNPDNKPFTIPRGPEREQYENQHLELPLMALIPGGFQLNWQLEIRGRVKILPHGFFINLQNGSHFWPHPTVAFHFRVQFPQVSNCLVVRNSCINGEWGKEEQTVGSQFKVTENFEIWIRRHTREFSLWVDGTAYDAFQFRTPVEGLNTLYIQGDVNIESVYLKEHVEDPFFRESE